MTQSENLMDNANLLNLLIEKQKAQNDMECLGGLESSAEEFEAFYGEFNEKMTIYG